MCESACLQVLLCHMQPQVLRLMQSVHTGEFWLETRGSWHLKETLSGEGLQKRTKQNKTKKKKASKQSSKQTNTKPTKQNQALVRSLRDGVNFGLGLTNLVLMIPVGGAQSSTPSTLDSVSAAAQDSATISTHPCLSAYHLLL